MTEIEVAFTQGFGIGAVLAAYVTALLAMAAFDVRERNLKRRAQEDRT